MKEWSWLIATLRALVYALCTAVFVWPLASLTSALAGGVGAAVGALLGLWLARGRVRSPLIVLGALLAGLLLEGLLRVLSRSDGIASALEPAGFLTLIDALRFGTLAVPVATTLSALSARHRTLAFVEVGLGGMMVSQLVAEHRHGAINRPFEIADPILAIGGDPSVVFYGLGMVAVLLLALVLILERNIGRLIAHLAVVALLVLLAGYGAEQGVLPRPEPNGGGLGLTGKPEGKHQPDSHGGKGKERRDNDTLEFRDQEQNKEKQTPVAVVLLHDDYSPPTGIYYFRQGAFSQFNGRRLIGTTRDGLDKDVSAGFPVDALEVPNAPQAGAERATLESTVALLADHTRPFGLESPVEFQAAQNPNPERFRRVYRVVSSALTGDFMTLLGRGAGDPRWSPDDRAEYLALPSDPRYGELAKKIANEQLAPEVKEDPMLKAWAISDWLGKEGTYSLKSKHAAATDPTGDFLFGDKVGYCVHFAHAATYLMRSLGVPARVATGYAIEESARQGGSAILISSGAAHAWPEVYLDGVGWVIVDVQPQRTLDPAPEPPDADLQRLLGQLARGVRPLPPDGSPPGAQWKDLLKEFARWAGTQVGRAIVLAFVAMYLIKLWRFLAPQLSASARLAYRAELDRLAELGISRRRGESREAFADRVQLPSFERLTQLHVGVRFGSQRALQSGKPELGALASGARSERAATFKWWRRVLGALVPWSFFKAR